MKAEHGEILDLVDATDVGVGTISRAEAWRTKARWVRVVNAFVVNRKSELWIPRRSASKEMFPLCLDMSVGGHVGAGESYEAALIRETQEELNVVLTSADYRELGYLNPVTHGLSAFMKVFEIGQDDAPDYNTDDFSSSEWVKPAILLERLAHGEAAKGDLEKLVRLFYA
ncbi:NUDIX hydrolase [soil metagenome]